MSPIEIDLILGMLQSLILPGMALILFGILSKLYSVDFFKEIADGMYRRLMK